MQKGLAVYVDNVDRENYVRFSSLSKDAKVDDDVLRFVYFMNKLGVQRKYLRYISGDQEPDSESARKWEKKLRIHVEPRPRGGDFGRKGDLSIGFSKQLNPKISIGSAALRYLFVMAFIAFGEIPLEKCA